MSKVVCKFFNDGEFENEVVLDESQQSFLKYILEWGFFNPAIEVVIEECDDAPQMPRTAICPDCGQECTYAYAVGTEGFYSCDTCDIEFGVDFTGHI